MSLTDDWKAGKLRKNKNYFVRVGGKKKKVYPARLYSDNAFSFCGNGTCYFPNGKQEIKVLAVCSYDHFVELTEKFKKFEKVFTEAIKYNDDLSAVITGCELEVNKLRELLKEGARLLSFEHETYEAENFIKEVNEVLND